MIKMTLNKAVAYLVLLICVFAAGWYAQLFYQHNRVQQKVKLVTSSSYTLTSPLLDIEFPEGISINQDPISFKQIVEDYIAKNTDGKQIRHIAVYFRDLMDGPWFGINEGYEFVPASMMKVPVMVAWLKRAEKNPQIFKQTFVYEGKVDNTAVQHFKPAKTLIAGHRYTVEELLHFMLSYSDNNAAELLHDNLKPEELVDVLAGMLVSNQTKNGLNSLTVHGYSGFFRVLYNSSYLNREMSEKALQLLSLEDFPVGISAGVPKGTVVASKFGEWVEGEHDEFKQLHEFGIIYHPKGAYILGIMTQGNDFARQSEVIRSISAIIYTAAGKS
jgi:beta-lactamase class A